MLPRLLPHSLCHLCNCISSVFFSIGGNRILNPEMPAGLQVIAVISLQSLGFQQIYRFCEYILLLMIEKMYLKNYIFFRNLRAAKVIILFINRYLIKRHSINIELSSMSKIIVKQAEEIKIPNLQKESSNRAKEVPLSPPTLLLRLSPRGVVPAVSPPTFELL